MATVVGRGMRWTNEAAQKAAQGQYYIKVGDKAGELLLSGAEKRWKQPANAGDIYIPALRVAGSPVAIQQLLALHNLQADQIAAYIQNGYSAANTGVGGALRASYEAELGQAKLVHQQAKQAKGTQPTAPGMTLAQLKVIAAQLPQARAVIARTATAGTTGGLVTVGTVSPKRGGRKKPLIERLRAAQAAGKVLDVSNMTADGSGVKPIARPGGKTAKIGPAGVPVVSSDAGKFAQAMAMLGAGFEQFAQQYNQLAAAKVVPVQPLMAPIVVPVVGIPQLARLPSPRGVGIPQLARLPSPRGITQLAALPTVVPRVPSPRTAAIPVMPMLAPLPTVRAQSPGRQGLPTALPQVPGLATIPALFGTRQ